MTAVVPVRLGARTYEARIGNGLIEAAGEHLRDLVANRLLVVADETVQRLHGARLARGLEAAGVPAETLVIAPGESSKTFAGLESLCERLLALGIERTDVVAAFGGGVAGDLAGFAAAIVKRGVDYVQIPTTLLAQVDSSVGGKTAIDTRDGKNLVGAFHQPRRVLADIGVLASLPSRERACGLAEILKIAMALDADFFAWLETNGRKLAAGDLAATTDAVVRAVQLKAAVVAADEREIAGGERALLNLGHTFGHAVEAASGFGDTLRHGEAVAIGCALATRFAAGRGDCSNADIACFEGAAAAAGLPIRLPPGLGAGLLVELMGRDKKVRGGRLTLILPRGVGKAFVATDINAATVRDFLITQGAAP